MLPTGQHLVKSSAECKGSLDIKRGREADTEGPGDVPTDSTAKVVATELQMAAAMAGRRARAADSEERTVPTT